MYLLSWSSAVIGVLMVAGAVAWRHVHRARIRTRIAAALGHVDTQRRRAGILVATELGLRAHADLLVDHLTREDDPEVLGELADGVLRNSWEPADRPAMLRLRLWAHEHRTTNPSVSSPRAAARAAVEADTRTDATPPAWPPVAVPAPPAPVASRAPVCQPAPPRPAATPDTATPDAAAEHTATPHTATPHTATEHTATEHPATEHPATERTAGRHAAGRHGATRPASSMPGAPQHAGSDVDGDAVTEILPVVGNPAPATPRRDVTIPAMRPPSEQWGVPRGGRGTAVTPPPTAGAAAVAIAVDIAAVVLGLPAVTATPTAAAPAPRAPSGTRLVPVDPLRQARAEKARRSTGTRHAVTERGAATLGDLTLRSPRAARSDRPRHDQHADLIATAAAAPAEQDSRRARHRAQPGRTSFVRSAV